MLSHSRLFILAAFALALATTAEANPGSAGEDQAAPAFETLRAWPAVDVRRWPGYDEVKPSLAAPAAEETVTPPPYPSAEARREAADEQWRRARAVAEQALALVRPEMIPLLAAVALEDAALPRGLTVTHGVTESQPYLELRFALGGDEPRLEHLRLLGDPRGDEPGFDQAGQWQARAEKAIAELYGYAPADISAAPVVTATRRSIYIDWRQQWRGVEFPAPWWTRFGAVRHGEALALAWTGPAAPADVQAAVDTLEGTPLPVSLNQAVMIAVKNLTVLMPTLVTEETLVWATMTLVTPGQEIAVPTRTLYRDEQVRDRQLQRGPVAAAWHIRITLEIDDPRSVHVWVDAVDGTLMCLGSEGPVAAQ